MNLVTFTTVDADGRIVRYGECEPEFLSARAQTGETLFEGLYPPNEYYFNGTGFSPLPPKPGPRYIFDRISGTWIYPIEVAEADARVERERLLRLSDWTDTVSAQARLGQQLYDEWQAYRQALRDVPEQTGFPLDVQWPVPPAG